MKRKLILFFEFFIQSISFFVFIWSCYKIAGILFQESGVFLLCNYNEENIKNIYNFIEMLGISAALWTFLASKKHARIQRAIDLVNEFESDEYFRQIRNFTRSIDKMIKNEIITEKQLIDLLSGKEPNNKIKKVLTNDNIDKYKKDLYIEYFNYLKYLFNYWLRVFASIQNSVADEKYILDHLGNIYIDQYNRFKTWIKENQFSAGLDLLYDYAKENNRGDWFGRLYVWWNK